MIESLRWITLALALFVGGYFIADGARALIKGDYFTPNSGRFAGEVGPWSHAVKAVGIEPRSTLMKVIFVTYGSVWLVVMIAFAIGAGWAWWGMLACAVGSLWYLPFGTLLGIVQVGLLIAYRQKTGG
ncbi:MAG: hypothetical protein H6814_09515 [Phycisphaeraceae bacterium]|nr:hypothetical protein [Phycisphaeraceae bacterium]